VSNNFENYYKKDSSLKNPLNFKSYNFILAYRFSGFAISFSPGFKLNNKHHFNVIVLVISGFNFNSKQPELCTISTPEYTLNCNRIRNLYNAVPATGDDENVSSWELSAKILFSAKTVCGKQFAVDIGAKWYMENSRNPFQSKRVTQSVVEKYI